MRLRRPSAFMLVLAIVALCELQDGIWYPSTIRLIENAACQKHFEISDPASTPVPEWKCKIAAVQSRVAYIRAGYGFFKTTPMLLVAPYFGRLADVRGRRLAYAIANIGWLGFLIMTYISGAMWKVLPLETIWLSGGLIFVGGGIYVLAALYMSMVTDLAPENNRGPHIYKAFAVKLAADMLAPQIAFTTLKRSIWLPFFLCGLCVFLSFPILLAMPETLRPGQKANLADTSGPSLRPKSGDSTILKDWRIILVLIVVFFSQFRYLTISILVPYVSTRFGWSIGDVSSLLSIIPAVSLAMFTILSWLKRGPSTHSVLKAGLVSLAIGSVLIALAPTTTIVIISLMIYGTGYGVRAPLLAIGSSYTKTADQTGRLYSLISMSDAFSHLVGEPLIQTAWASAVESGGWKLGLPFIGLSATFFMASTLALVLPHVSVAGNVHPATQDTAASENEPFLQRPSEDVNDSFFT